MLPPERNGIDKAVETVRALRGEHGCPWDKAQTHASLRKYLLEETYEVLEALDAHAARPSAQTLAHFKEELGDLLLQVLLHSEIAHQDGHFDIQDVAGELSTKLIRRHPHVFGENQKDSFGENQKDSFGENQKDSVGENNLNTAEEVVVAWEKTKLAEKPKQSALDGIPPALPALQRSIKVIEKVSRVGFQWPDLKGPLEKVREEVGELQAELDKIGETLDRESAANLAPETKRKLEGELGDLLFTISNVAHFLHVNPEDALRSMLARFEGRFRSVELGAMAQNKKLEEMTLDEMDLLWAIAKQKERDEA